MNDKEKKQISDEFRALTIKGLVSKGDALLDLSSSEFEIRSMLKYGKEFLKDAGYRKELPRKQEEALYRVLNDLVQLVKAIEQQKADDPTAVLRQRDSYIRQIEARYSDFYSQLIVPYRQFSDINLDEEDISKEQETIEAIETLQESSVVESNEAISNVYSNLAERYEKRFVIWAAIVAVFIVTTAALVLWVANMTPREDETGAVQLLQNFDTTAGLTLKFVLLVIFGYALNFMAKNMQTNQNAAIIARTREVNLGAWRDFVNAPEIAADRDIKAYIVEKLANQIFADLQIHPDKKSAALVDNPVNFYRESRNN